MSDKLHYLKPNVKIEPLMFGWYAWTHLIPPAQLAMNLSYRQLPLLQSFIRNPAVHTAAAKDRSLYGGPFVQLDTAHVPAIRELLEDAQVKGAALIEFAKSLKDVDRQLQESATGYSLSDMYKKVPASLRGLVEFIYDLNNHAKLRLHEELLYDETLNVSAQEILLHANPDEERPFFMSTPRLAGEGAIRVTRQFLDPAVDLLVSMRTKATPLSEVAAALGVKDGDLTLFRTFFSEAAGSRRSPDYSADGVRIRYFGHACVLVQTRETSILIDPMLAWDPDRGDGRFTFMDLPDSIDYIVISHGHQDHCTPEMLIQLRSRTKHVLVPVNNGGCLADPSLKLMLKALGMKDVQVLHPFDEVRFSDGRITSLPFAGEHVDLDIHSRQGIYLEIAGRRFCFLVDSDGCEPALFRRIARRTGRKLDALFIGMECHGAPLTWLYGPLLTQAISRRNDDSRRLSGMDSERAWNAVCEFDADRIFVYAMGQEPWIRYIMGLEYSPDSVQLKEVAAFLKRCRDANMCAESLYISKEFEVS
jgi:L-ascorbate metabolism protein UlaG (beta-lactamase superfamily)